MQRLWTLPLLALLLQGCAVHLHPLGDPVRPAKAIPDEIQSRFGYAVVSSVTLTRVWSDDTAEVSDGAFRIHFPGEFGIATADMTRLAPENEDEAKLSVKDGEAGLGKIVNGSPGTTAEGEGQEKEGEATVQPPKGPDAVEIKFEYWRSLVAGSEPAPVILVTPILGGGADLARTHCMDFVQAGMHVMLVWRGTKVLRRTWAMDDLERFLRWGVAARKALLDWAETRPEIDPDRLASFGISMGGLLNTVLMASDPRIHSGVIALAGGDVPSIINTSTERPLIRFREAKMEEFGIDPETFVDQLRAALPSDPGKMASYVDPRRVFFLSARYDDVIRPEYQEQLWEALGRPVRYDLPAGHYGAILYLPYVTDLIVDWYKKRLVPASSGKRTVHLEVDTPEVRVHTDGNEGG